MTCVTNKPARKQSARSEAEKQVLSQPPFVPPPALRALAPVDAHGHKTHQIRGSKLKCRAAREAQIHEPTKGQRRVVLHIWERREMEERRTSAAVCFLSATMNSTSGLERLTQHPAMRRAASSWLWPAERGGFEGSSGGKMDAQVTQSILVYNEAVCFSDSDRFIRYVKEQWNTSKYSRYTSCLSWGNTVNAVFVEDKSFHINKLYRNIVSLTEESFW